MKFQYINIIPGLDESRFPCCTSILIDDGSTVAIIDPGAGSETLLNLIKKII